MAANPWTRIRNARPEENPQMRLVSSSDLFVCNSNALTVATDIDDPVQMAQSGEGLAVIPFPASGYPFFDLFLIAGNDGVTPDNAVPTIPVTTQCKVRAFGRAPYNNDTPVTGGSNAHLLPSDFDAAVFDALRSAAVGRAYYLPLYSADGTHEQTFGATPEMASNSVGTKRFVITGGLSYFTRGCTDILVLISQALVQTGATKAMVMAALGTN